MSYIWNPVCFILFILSPPEKGSIGFIRLPERSVVEKKDETFG